MTRQLRFPAVITAGGRIEGAFAARAETHIKALAPVGGVPTLARILAALRANPHVGRIVVVGPSEIEAVARQSGADQMVPEGKTGPENMLRGLMAVRENLGEGHALLCATDVAFLDPAALDGLIHSAARDVSTADIIFPVIARAEYDSRYPGSPNTWAKIAGQEYTGSSVQLVRPAALERNHLLIEQVFAARKSQWQMARLLGLPFALKFLAGRLTISEVEIRASRITGCCCRALLNADARLALDMDTVADYDYALSVAREADKAPLAGGEQGR